MRKINIFSFILVMILLPALVVQAQTIELTGNTDCEGWSAFANLNFPSDTFSADLIYSVVLTDLAGVEVTRFDYSGLVKRYEDPVMMKMYGAYWDLTLDSVYVAQFEFNFMGQEASMTYDVVCGEVLEENDPVAEPCRRSPGFWKTNPEQWPVENLAVGGIEMSQSELVNLMKAPVRGDGRVLMARELIAAKLNVANGCDNSINGSIDEGDLFLTESPLSENAGRNSMRQTRDLRHALSAYNKAECEELVFDIDGSVNDLQFKATAIEQTTFGALKAMYR